ncbi:MAG: MFS transporter [Cyclobacteriaceae bacterium]|nr:MFS transporter [Cyclobacteriaceae bacterium]
MHSTKISSFKMIFAASCLGMLTFGIVMITIGSLLPDIVGKFDLSNVSAGFLTSILPLGILLGSLVFGPVADRYGFKLIFITCALLVFAGLEGIAFADSLPMLHLAVFLIGFGGGVLNGGTNALVADVSAESKGANLSVLGVFYGIGALGMPALLGILSDFYRVENIVMGVGGAVLLITTYFIYIRFPAPKQPQGFPLKEGGKLIKSSVLLLGGMTLFCASGAEGLINNWTTSYLLDYEIASQQQGLFVLSLLMVALTVMRMVLGRLLKQTGPFRVMLVLNVVAIIGCGLLYMHNIVAIGVAIVLIGVGLAANFPVVLGYVGEVFPKLSGTAFSIVLVMALTGNMISNFIMGNVAEKWGTALLPVMMGVQAVLIITFMLLFKNKFYTASLEKSPVDR